VSNNIILVLGNRLISENIHLELKARMDAALSLRRLLLDTKPYNKIFMLLSGGASNPNVASSEAEVMKAYCIENNIPQYEIILETKSLDTIGNAVFSRRIVDMIKDIDVIYVVSSCYHMERATFIFEMCFGDKYKLNFNNCNIIQNSNFVEKERKGLIQSHNFFAGIEPGDILSIEARLFREHDLYHKEI
jgi:uncharacterized SAM-binding protein YcdF (DUF218 family)